MKCTWVAALLVGLFAAAPARAAIILEFFQGTGVNDTVLSLTPFPNDTVTLVPGGPRQFVQVAMHQTAPTNLLTPDDGLSDFFIQGDYGPNQMGNWVVPSTGGPPNGTIPLCHVADPLNYSLVRAYRTGPGGINPGGTESTATAFRFAGLGTGAPPHPSVDANGRIFLGTFALQSHSGSPGTANSSIVFRDPNPAPLVIDNITDMGDNLDAILFANGTTYPLNITVVPEPTSLFLSSLVVGGVVGLRWRRQERKTQTPARR